MINIVGQKLVLKEATHQDFDELYYWKYEEKEQEAKKWNGPYIPEPKITKGEFLKSWGNEYEITTNTPNSLIVFVGDKLIGTVSSYWVDKNTNWLETGIVIYDKNYWNGGYGTEAYKLWDRFLIQVHWFTSIRYVNLVRKCKNDQGCRKVRNERRSKNKTGKNGRW